MPRIFISYRRSDSISITGRIYDRLVSAFGDDSVFKDVDDIPLGADFRRVLEKEVGACNVLLVIIGPRWVNVTDEQGKRRLDDPNDFVRIEVESGLKRNDIIVVPTLVSGALMPSAADLPGDLTQLAYRNAASVRDDPDFNHDIRRLIDQLKAVDMPAASIPPAAQAPAPARKNPSSRVWMAGLAALIVLMAAAFLIYKNLGTSDSPTPTPQGEQTQAAATNEAAQSGGVTAWAVTRMSYINVRSEPNADAEDIGDIVRSSEVVVYPNSRTAGDWIRVTAGELSGWVNGEFVSFVDANSVPISRGCNVADGYDAPIGTEEERRTDEVWPGDWFDGTGYLTLTMSGYSTGADLNLNTPVRDSDAHSPVYAVASGAVIFAAELPVWGNVIVIQHDPLQNCNGQVLYSRYAPLENMLVSAGDRVARGQQIASIGKQPGGSVYYLSFDLSASSILLTEPGFTPSRNQQSMVENFVDPRLFIEEHRPSE